MKLDAWVFLALFVSTGMRLVLVLGEKVPFNGDEAIVALMARHILQGETPLFFYGQAYMGSLDAWLVAGAFRLFGESVFSIRIVQILLYGAFIFTLALLARRLFQDKQAAGFAVLLSAVPGVLVTTYTTASLGGYGETLVLGILILLLGYEVVHGKYQETPAAWLGLGLAGGLGFWTLGMSGVYLLPVALLGLIRFSLKRVPLYAVAGFAFLIGSGPWWYSNLAHGWTALQAVSGEAMADTTLLDRIVGFLVIGLPALIEIRFPWSGEFAPLPVLFAGLVIFFAALLYFLNASRRQALPLQPGAQALLGTLILVWLGVFIGTQYGLDATGRYLLPLYVPLVLAEACLIWTVYQKRRFFGWVLLALLLAFNGLNIWRASQSPDKLTTQFDPITSFDNRYDQALIEFLKINKELRGYSNYWASFRIAFLSGEELLFAPMLPYKADLSYTARDNRIPAYLAAADQSPQTAYITTQHPALDQELRKDFTSLDVSFSEVQIGPYRVFYDLSRPVRPGEMGFGFSTPEEE